LEIRLLFGANWLKLLGRRVVSYGSETVVWNHIRQRDQETPCVNWAQILFTDQTDCWNSVEIRTGHRDPEPQTAFPAFRIQRIDMGNYQRVVVWRTAYGSSQM